MKKLINKILQNQFWFLTSIETLLIGVIIASVDWSYSEHMPTIFSAFEPPYLAFFMIAFGVYSLIYSIHKINLTIILGNIAVWSYISVASLLLSLTEHSTIVLMPEMVVVISSIILLRILMNAYNIDLKKGEC